MKAYIFIFLLFIISCSKDEDMITFEISVVNVNTRQPITEGLVLLNGIPELKLFNPSPIYEYKISITDTLNTFITENNRDIEFFTIEYYKKNNLQVVQFLNGCELYKNENSTCTPGRSKYNIEIQVFE